MLRDEQKEGTRLRVLAAAAALFKEQSYEETTTRSIAVRAGVATGTVFVHFPDKAAIAEAMLEDHVERALSAALRSLPRRGLGPRLLAVANALFRAYDAEPELSKVLLRQGLFATSADGPLSKQLGRFRAWVASQVSEAAAHGEHLLVSQPHFFAGFFSIYFGLLVAGLQGQLTNEGRLLALSALLGTMSTKGARRRPAPRRPSTATKSTGTKKRRSHA
jgi:AcrR family transcriptional regulator